MTTSSLLRGPVKKDRPAPVERTVERRDATGAVLSTVALEPTIFGIEPNVAVLHQVVTAQLAAKRAGTQSTRTRAEVRGGGHKPYRQKGTGHARQGSTNAPHYVGGGVAFAPKPRSYAQRTPKKMVRLALRSALSDRASEHKVALLDRFTWEAPKTRDAVALFGALGLEGTVLVVLSRTDGVAARAMRNLEGASTVDAGELNAHDVLAHDWVLFTDETLPVAEPGIDEPGTDEPGAATGPAPRATSRAKKDRTKGDTEVAAETQASPRDETEGAT